MGAQHSRNKGRDRGAEGLWYGDAMGWARGSLFVVIAVAAQVANAQPKSEQTPLLGAQPVLKASASTGFVDDVVAGEGDRFAYVIADGNTKAALHMATLAAGKMHDGATSPEQIVDIS